MPPIRADVSRPRATIPPPSCPSRSVPQLINTKWGGDWSKSLTANWFSSARRIFLDFTRFPRVSQSLCVKIEQFDVGLTAICILHWFTTQRDVCVMLESWRCYVYAMWAELSCEMMMLISSYKKLDSLLTPLDPSRPMLLGLGFQLCAVAI